MNRTAPGRVDRMLLAGLALTALGLLWLTAGFLSFPGGDAWGYDYLAYRDAAVRFGDTGTLYQDETLSGPYRPGPYGLYMYAPPLGLAVAPTVDVPLEAAILFWYLLHVAALAMACSIMPIKLSLRLAVFGIGALSLAVTRDLVLGNVSVLLLLPVVMAWRWLDQPLGSVAQAVAISVRPMLGVLMIWQLLRRQWRAVAWTIGAGLVLILLTLPFVGADGYLDYLTVLRNLSHVTGVERNYDLSSTVVDLGFGDTAATTALLAGYALAVAAMLLSLRRDREIGFMVTLSGSLLLSPLLWDHYLAMLLLPAAFLAERGRPWAIVLPLAAWLPAETYPVTIIVATLLPFLAPDRAAPTSGLGIPTRSVAAPAGSA